MEPIAPAGFTRRAGLGKALVDTDSTPSEGSMSEIEDEDWRDPGHIPLDDLSDAMALYPADGGNGATGPVDALTGGESGGEAEDLWPHAEDPAH